MMKTIYYFDSLGRYYGGDDIADNAIIPANATAIAPVFSLPPLRDVFNATTQTWTPTPPDINAQRAVMAVSAKVFRRNLIKLGYYNAALTAIGKLAATSDVAINFQYSGTFERLNPELLALAAQFNLTDAQIDAIFTA